MSLAVVTEPEKSLSTIDSNVVAVKTQALYEFKREDNACTYSNDGGGKVKVTFTGIDLTSEYVRFDSIFVGDANVSPQYNLIGVITSVTVFAAGDTTFVTDITFVSAPSNAYTNNISRKTNYRLDIQVFNGAGTVQLIDETFQYVPKQEGTVKPDLKDLFLFLLKKDSITFLDVKPKYREAWTGNEAGAYTSLNNILIVRAERQIQDQQGANLLEYLLQKELSYTIQDWVSNNNQQTLRINDGAGVGNVTAFFPDGRKIFVDSSALPYSAPDRLEVVESTNYSTPHNNIRTVTRFEGNWGAAGTVKPFVFGKFLTKFKRPRMWRYWAMAVYYLMDEDFASRTSATFPKIAEISLNVNDVEQSTLLNQNTGVVVGVITYQIVNTDISDEGMKIRIRDSNTGIINLIDPLIMDIDNGQFDNPIMLQWLNELGGFDQWIFQVEQEINPTYSAGLTSQRPVTDDISSITYHVKAREDINLTQKLTLTVDKLTQNQAETIQYLSKSDVVYVWIQRDSTNRIGVIVDTDIYSYSNSDKLFEVSLTIKMPPNFDFFKAKKY